MPKIKYLIETKSGIDILLYPLSVNRTLACGRVAVSRSGRVFAVTEKGAVYVTGHSHISCSEGANERPEVRLSSFPEEDIDALDALSLIDGDKMKEAKREACKNRQRGYVQREIDAAVALLKEAGVTVSKISAATAYVDRVAERRMARRCPR